MLGFYYFDLELSHMNPLLNKRIGMLNLEYLMERGASNVFVLLPVDLYKEHIKDIAREIATNAMVCRLEMSGKMKGMRCYCLKPSNPSKISDIGVVLSYLSKSHGM